MAHTEVESKFELTSKDFERLQELGTVEREEEQLNVYYDAQWKLAERSATFRIRFQLRGPPVLTLKVPRARYGFRRVMDEFEMPLESGLFAFSSIHPTRIDVQRELPNDLRECLAWMDVKDLHRVGWVRNRRLLILISGIGHLELDRLELPDGTVVHEAEIECADVPTHEKLVELIRIHFPTAKASRLSKFQRFRNATTVHCDESHVAHLDETAW